MASYLSTDRYKLTDSKRYADRKPQESTKFAVYTSRDGDTFDLLAVKFLGDSNRYWEIADINPQIEWPDQIPTGSSLRIPI
jgi:nucleoid-associated protein YgaU